MDERIREIIRQLDLRDNDIDLELFAELIRADEREQISHTYLKLTLEAVLREREACAKLIDPYDSTTEWAKGLAKAIRQRGEQP